MKNIWILGQAESHEAPSIMEGRPVSNDTEYEGSTKVPPPADANREGRGKGPGGGLFSSPLILLILMVVMFYFVLFRGPRKKQQEHKQMVQSLEKNDRIRTIGGIIGTVVDIKDDEITLKVDESNNTKIKVASSAIGRNLSKENRQR